MNVLERYLADSRLQLVDVGARGGIASRWEPFASLLDVTAFEPDAAECERLNREASSLPYPIRYLPVGLWRESAEGIPFHVTNWPVASSVRRPNAEFLRSFPWADRLLGVKETETITVTTLDDIASREELSADCLKVDVEGAALDVLIGAEDTVRQTLVLEVEAELNPLFEGEALFPAVDWHLRQRGWALHGLRRTSWRRGPLDPSASGLGGQIVSVDALYSNGALIDGGLSLTQELKLLATLSAYEQLDTVLARLADLRRAGDRLTAAEIDELRDLLVPPSAPDQLQPGNATVWEDQHFF